jgi:hypothetical protein
MAPPFNPVHAVVQHCLDAQAHQLPLFGQEDPWLGLVAASLSIDLPTLKRFTDAMADLGVAVDPARMFLDPSYAYGHLATAHAGNDESLKALSLQLFERYQQLEQRRRGGVDRPVLH